MAAYVIADLDVQKPDLYEGYRGKVLATIEKFGGRYLVNGGAHEVLEGEWRPTRVVVVEFPDMATLKRWYASPDYQSLLPIRLNSAATDVIAAEGA